MKQELALQDFYRLARNREPVGRRCNIAFICAVVAEPLKLVYSSV